MVSQKDKTSYELDILKYNLEKNYARHFVFEAENEEVLIEYITEFAETLLSFEDDDDIDLSFLSRNHYRVKLNDYDFVFVRGQRSLSIEYAEALLDSLCVDKCLTVRRAGMQMFCYNLKKKEISV